MCLYNLKKNFCSDVVYENKRGQEMSCYNSSYQGYQPCYQEDGYKTQPHNSMGLYEKPKYGYPTKVNKCINLK